MMFATMMRLVNGERMAVTPHVARLIDLDIEHACEQRSAEWHTKRGRYITASQIAGVIGVKGAFENRREILAKKLGISSDQTTGGAFSSRATSYGTEMEPLAQARYERHVGKKCINLGLIPSLNPGEEHYAASVDGVTADGTLVEFKCPYSRIPTDEVPAYYVPQVQFMMNIFNLERCDFVQFVPETSWTHEVLIVTRINRDREWMETVRPMIDGFWRDVCELRSRPAWELSLPNHDSRLDPRLACKKRAVPTSVRLLGTNIVTIDTGSSIDYVFLAESVALHERFTEEESRRNLIDLYAMLFASVENKAESGNKTADIQ